MEVYGQLFDRDSALIEQEADTIDNLVGGGHADGITKRKFINAHFQQRLRDFEYLVRGDGTFVGAAKDGRDIAAYGDIFLLCQCYNGTEIGKALGNSGVDVMTGETFTGGCKYGNGSYTCRYCTFHAFQVGYEDRIGCRG